MSHYIDVIIPLPLERLFAYRVTAAEADILQPGMRVAVPFGKSKIYTGIVHHKHQSPPLNYEVKDIELIVDEFPTVTTDQLKFWEWISSYYVCSIGQVMRAALPKSLMLESETIILKNPDTEIDEDVLDDKQFLIIEALLHRPALKVKEVMDILDRKSVLPILKSMLEQEWIILQEEVYSTYKPKTIKYIFLNSRYKDEEHLKNLLDDMTRAPKQRDTVMSLFMLQTGNKLVTSKLLQDRAGVSRAVIKA